MYGCESWTIKKAEPWRIDAFKLWCWRRPLRVPWTVRKYQSTLKEISPECSLEGLMLKLWPPDAKNWLIAKDPDAGKDWRREEKGMTEDEMIGWHYWFDGHEFVQAPGVGDRQRGLVYSVHGELDTISDWTELNWSHVRLFYNPMVAHQCSSVHDISQARILEWVTISFSRGSS